MNNNNNNYKYLYIISAYEGGRGYVASGLYKMNSDTEETKNACKEDFKKNNPEAGYYMHLCLDIVIEIKDIGTDIFIKDGDKCLIEYIKQQKEIEKEELSELNRLKKKYNS